jgi:voltage-gated potassium channel
MKPRDGSRLKGQAVSGGRVGSIIPTWWRRVPKATLAGTLTVGEPASARPPRLWSRSSVRRIAGGLAALCLVLVYGVSGYVAFGWNPFDALFMVVITIFGVGYGEVLPLDAPWLRVHTMFVIALGVIAVAYTVAGFVQFVAEGEIQQLLGHQRVRRQIETMTGHIVLAGFGRMGSLLCAELAAAGESFVLIERSGDHVAELERRGILYLIGDATEEKVLQEGRLIHARALVSTVPSDAENVFITLTARQMAPKVLIVARAELPTTQKKLRQAGADHVVLPSAIGAHRIASLLTNPSAVEFAELVTQRSSLQIEMDEVPVRASGPLDGLTLRHADIGRRTGVIVIAVKRADGRVEFPPSGDEPFAPGDSIVLLGRRSNLDQFRQEFRKG